MYVNNQNNYNVYIFESEVGRNVHKYVKYPKFKLTELYTFFKQKSAEIK